MATLPGLEPDQEERIIKDGIQSQRRAFRISEGPYEGRVALKLFDPRVFDRDEITQTNPITGEQKQVLSESMDIHFDYSEYRQQKQEFVENKTKELLNNPEKAEPGATELNNDIVVLSREQGKEYLKNGTVNGKEPFQFHKKQNEKVQKFNKKRIENLKEEIKEERLTPLHTENIWVSAIAAVPNALGRLVEEVADTAPAEVAGIPGAPGTPDKEDVKAGAEGRSDSDLIGGTGPSLKRFNPERVVEPFESMWDSIKAIWKERKEDLDEGGLSVATAKTTSDIAGSLVGFLKHFSDSVISLTNETVLETTNWANAMGRAGGFSGDTKEQKQEIQRLRQAKDILHQRVVRNAEERKARAADWWPSIGKETVRDVTLNILAQNNLSPNEDVPKTDSFHATNTFLRMSRAHNKMNGAWGKAVATGMNVASGIVKGIPVTVGGLMFSASLDISSGTISQILDWAGDEEGAKAWANVADTGRFFESSLEAFTETNVNDPDQAPFESLGALGADFMIVPTIQLAALSKMKRPKTIDITGVGKVGEYLGPGKLKEAVKGGAAKGFRLADWWSDGKLKEGALKMVAEKLNVKLDDLLKILEIDEKYQEERESGEKSEAQIQKERSEEIRRELDVEKREGEQEVSFEEGLDVKNMPEGQRLEIGLKMIKQMDAGAKVWEGIKHDVRNSEKLRNAIESLPEIKFDSLLEVTKQFAAPFSGPPRIRRAMREYYLEASNRTGEFMEALLKNWGEWKDSVPDEISNFIEAAKSDRIPEIRESIRKGEMDKALQYIRKQDGRSDYAREIENLARGMVNVEALSTLSELNKSGGGREAVLRDMFFEQVADEFGGEASSGRREFTAEVLRRVIDETFTDNKAESMKGNLISLFQKNLDALVRGRIDEGAERGQLSTQKAAEIAEAFIDEVFTERAKKDIHSTLMGKEGGATLKSLLTQMLLREEKEYHRGEEFQFSRRGSDFDILTGKKRRVGEPAEGNLAYKRMRPFLNIVDWVKEEFIQKRGREVEDYFKEGKGNDGGILKGIIDSFEGRVGEKENFNPRERIQQITEALIFSQEPTKETAKKIRGTIGKIMKDQADRSFDKSRLYTDNIGQLMLSIRESILTDNRDPQVTRSKLREVQERILENRPSSRQEMMDQLKMMKREDVIKSEPEKVMEDFEMRIIERMRGEEPGVRRPTFLEYMRNPEEYNKKPSNRPLGETAEKLDEFQERNKDTTELGVSPKNDLERTIKFLEDNLGSEHHRNEDWLARVRQDLAEQGTATAKALRLFEILAEHPDFSDVLKKAEGEPVKKLMGKLLETGELDILRKLDLDTLNLDTIVRERDGILRGLPSQEAKTYYLLRFAGMPHDTALNRSIEAFHERLDRTASDRLDAIDKMASVEHAKELFPKHKEGLEELSQRLRDGFFEEHENNKERVPEIDEAREKYDNPEQVVREAVNDALITDELEKQIREEVGGDMNRVWINWIEELLEDSNLSRHNLQQFSREQFDKRISELNNSEFPHVIDWIKAKDRKAYEPRRDTIPDNTLLDLYDELGMDYYDPRDWQTKHIKHVDKEQGKEREPLDEEELSKEEQEFEEKSSSLEEFLDQAEKVEKAKEKLEGETPHEDLSTARKFYDYLLRSVEKGLEKLPGENGAEIVRLIQMANALRDSMFTRLVREHRLRLDMLREAGIKKTTKAPGQDITIWRLIQHSLDFPDKPEVRRQAFEQAKEAAREVGGERAERAVTEARNSLRERLDFLGDRMEKMGVERLTLQEDGSFGFEPFEKIEEGYWPRRPKESAKRDIEYQDWLRDHLQREYGLSGSEASKRVKNLIDQTNPRLASNLDFARVKDMTEYNRELDALPKQYFHQWARRMSERKFYGRRGEKLQNLISKIGAEHGVQVGEWAQHLTELAVRGHTKNQFFEMSRTIGNPIRKYQLMTKLGPATAVPNAGQWIMASLPATDYIRAIPKAVYKLITDKEFGKKVSEAGTTANQLIRDLQINTQRSLVDPLMRTNLLPFKATETMNRRIAPAIGLENARYLLGDLKEQIEKGRGREHPEVKRILKRLERNGLKDGQEFGGEGMKTEKIDLIETAKRGQFSQLERIILQNSFTNRTQFRGRNIDQPAGWSHPMGQIFSQFQIFSFRWAKLFWDEILTKRFDNIIKMEDVSLGKKAELFTREAVHRGAALGSIALTGIPMGSLMWKTRALIDGREDEMYNDGAWTYFKSIGGLGLPGSIFQSAKYARSFPDYIQNIVGGPTVSDLTDLGGPVMNEKGWDGKISGFTREVSEKFIRLTPFIGGGVSERMFKGGDIQSWDDVIDRTWNWRSLEEAAVPRKQGFPPKKPSKTMRWAESLKRFMNKVYREGFESIDEATGADTQELFGPFSTERERHIATTPTDIPLPGVE